MKFENQEFVKQDVLLDGNEFINCKFKECQIRVMAMASGLLDGNSFVNCNWVFDGPADNTLQFMTALYAQGGYFVNLIEQTFENIRRGTYKPGPRILN